MARRERLQNNSSTTLDGGITAGATTVTVADGSVFPSEGDFRILVEDELMLVTARSTNDLTVTRGVEGTTGVTHASGTTVRMILTEQGIENYVRESAPYHGYSPALRITNASDAIVGEGDFTWVNQGGATATDLATGAIRLKVPNAAGASVRAKVISAPSTPYVVTAAIDVFMPAIVAASGQPRLGLCFRESATGKITLHAIRRTVDAQTTGDAAAWAINTDHFTNATTFDFGAAVNREWWWMSTGPLWIRIEDDGTDLNFYISPDGMDWKEIYTEARGSFFTTAPDQIGFAGNSSGAGDEIWLTLHHFSVV